MAHRRKNRIGSRNKHVRFAIVLAAFALLLGGGAYFLTSLLGHAFEGPSQSAGTGGGVIRSEGPNISVGTSSSPGSSRFFLVASSTLASDYAVRMVQPDGTVIFLVRNDQKVSIATSTPSGSTSTLIVAGNALITGNLTAAGTYGQFSGTVNAINVSAGYFGSQTGGGNYAFPASLSIATSTIPTGGVLFVNGNVGIGTSAPGTTLHVYGPSNNDKFAAFGVSNATGTDGLNVGYGGSSLGAGQSFINAHSATAGNGQLRLMVNADTKMTIGNDGRVGIGTSTPALALDVKGQVRTGSGVANGLVVQPSSALPGFYSNLYSIGTADETLVLQSWASKPLALNPNGNYVGIGTSTPSTALHVIGDVTAAGYYYSSDVRLKYDIRPISGLAGITGLRGVEFKWVDSGESAIGLIAQEVESKYPSAVRTDASGMKTVNYGALVAPLIESVKELNAEIEKQNSRIRELEHEIQTLRLD